MNMRVAFDKKAGTGPLVASEVGDAYPSVEKVAEVIDKVVDVSDNLDQLLTLRQDAETAVINANYAVEVLHKFPGGQIGTYLRKKTITDYDFEWIAPNKADISLGNVDNTADSNKPVSTAQANAIADVATYAAEQLSTHATNALNPHAVTKAQVGLGNADNTSDINKPVSTAQQAALDGKEPGITAGTTLQYFRGNKTWADFGTSVRATTLAGLSTATNAVISLSDTVLSAFGKLQKQVSDNKTAADNHIGSTTNPHSTTAAQVGLGNVLNVAQIPATEKGAANGVVPLDATTKIAAAYLPSYVDDVIEATNQASFPGTGETGKIYVALDVNKTFRWSGSAYVEISASPGSTDAVTEGTTNKYYTDTRVRAAVLTGLSLVTNAAISAADTVLSAFGKVQKQITDLIATVGLKANAADAALTGTATAVNLDIGTMLEIPVWTTGTRPANGNGRIGYNSTLQVYEGCNNGVWFSLGNGTDGLLLTGSQGITFPDSSVQKAAGFTGSRNRIMNGDMRFSRRYGDTAVNHTLGSATYAIERWRNIHSVTGKTYIARTPVDVNVAGEKFSHCALTAVTTAYTPVSTDFFAFEQVVEQSAVYDLQGKQMTVSFYSAHDQVGTYAFSLLSSTGRSCVLTYQQTTASVWQKQVLTIPADASPGAAMSATSTAYAYRFIWDQGHGSNFNAPTAGVWSSTDYRRMAGCVSLITQAGYGFRITGVQLEAGGLSPFERRFLDIDRALIDRYSTPVYCEDLIAGIADSASTLWAHFVPKTPFRVTPAATLHGSGGMRFSDDYSGDIAAATPTLTTNQMALTGGRLRFSGFSGATTARAYSGFNDGTSRHFVWLEAEL